MKSMCHELRRNSPSVAERRPASAWSPTTSRIASSSTARRRSAAIRPSANRARASCSSGGRSRLPTWSARNGGVVRGAIREEGRIRRTGRRRLGGHEPHTLPREPKARGHEKGSRPPPHRAGDPRRGACVAPQSLDALRRDELTGLHVGRLKHWAAPLDLDYLEIEILSIEPLDVKKNCVKLPGVAPSPPEQDHVDAFLSRIHLAFPDL